VVKVLCYKSEGRWFDPSWCHWNLSLSFRSHYDPGVDSASNRTEYQEHFLGDKGGRCVGLKILSLSCAVVMKSGNLNFLEPSGPLKACNGTALPVPLPSKLRVAAISYLGFLLLILYVMVGATYRNNLYNSQQTCEDLPAREREREDLLLRKQREGVHYYITIRAVYV